MFVCLQAVIATDGNETYAMFSYDVIRWNTDKQFDPDQSKPEDIVYARVKLKSIYKD